MLHLRIRTRITFCNFRVFELQDDRVYSAQVNTSRRQQCTLVLDLLLVCACCRPYASSASKRCPPSSSSTICARATRTTTGAMPAAAARAHSRLPLAVRRAARRVRRAPICRRNAVGRRDRRQGNARAKVRLFFFEVMTLTQTLMHHAAQASSCNFWSHFCETLYRKCLSERRSKSRDVKRAIREGF